MRLIDADKLLDALCDGCTGIPCEGNRHGSMEECQSVRIMRDVIHEQPTAYDVEKAVEVLENEKAKKNDTITLCDAEVNGIIDLAINIVKRGGADGR